MPREWPFTGRHDELRRIEHALVAPQTRCVIISGASGLGKTRLAREIAARPRRVPWRVRWAIGTDEARTIPLGAVAHLLPGLGARSALPDRFGLLGWARRGLTEPAYHHDLLIVDDAQLLDATTAALVQQLVGTDPAVRLLLTVRRTDVPSWLETLSHDDRVEQVRLDPLDNADINALLDRALAGSIDPATRAMLSRDCGGNPLWLGQLIRDGLDGGALAQRHDVWSWDGPIGLGGLTGLLSSRLDGLPAAEVSALEMIALGEPIPIPMVRRLGIEDAVATLERRDLVDIDAAGQLRTAHRLYGGLVRARATTMAARVARRRLAEAFRDSAPPGGADVLRIARWCLDGGDSSDVELMLEASRQALHVDPGLAERFARQACAGSDRFDTRYMLGRSLLEQGQVAEAAAVYEALRQEPLSVDEQASVAADLAMIAFWTHGDADRAIMLLREIEAGTSTLAPDGPGLRASVELFSGATTEAVRAALVAVNDPGSTPDAVVRAALTAIPALVATGRIGDAIAVAERADALSAEPASRPPGTVCPSFADAQLSWAYAWALRWAARVDQAVAYAVGQLSDAARGGERHAYSYGLLEAAAGGAHLAAGNVTAARDTLRAAAATMRESDLTGTVVSCLADLARAEALSGDVGRAEALLAEASRRNRPGVHLFDASLGQARSVVAALGGETARARREASEAAGLARRWEQPAIEAACLHLLVRFGDPATAVGRLCQIASQTDAPLVTILAEHAQAAAARDARGLDEVAGRFAAAGSWMLAADVAATAARTHRRAGRSGAADRAAHRSRGWSARCPGAPAPALLVEPSTLTAREADIVGLARRGLTNRQIAEKLVVSVRTVESHLQHAYMKLGISSRSHLSEPLIGL